MEHFVIKRNTSVIKRNTFLESGLSNWSTETLLKNQGKKFWGAKWSARTGNEDELKEKKCGCFLRGETSHSITVIFWVSQKVEKCQFYFTHFSMKTASKKKNGVHHDGATGKYFETVISDFLILKLCHRDFSRQSSLESKMLKILQIIKIWDSNELSWGCDKVIFVLMIKINCCNIRKS